MDFGQRFERIDRPVEPPEPDRSPVEGEGEFGDGRHAGGHGGDDAEGIAFRDLGRRLMSSSREIRRDAALLVSSFTPAEAARPLVRAYVHTGDRALLEAVRAYGDRLTGIVAREALDFSLAPSHRARLMEILGATGDPSAGRVLREASKDLDRTVRVAASAALAELGDGSGLARLDAELLSNDAVRRARALEALRGIETPEARRLATEHALRYLAEGGAVPAEVGVTLPVLIDPDKDLVALLGPMAASSGDRLTLVTGPATGRLSDLHRADFAAALPARSLHFTTDRHSLDEQRAVLEAACADAASADPRPIVLFGPLPTPADAFPSPHLLPPPEVSQHGGGLDDDAFDLPFSVQVVFVGPHKFQPVMEWCGYFRDVCPYPARMHVVLADLRFGGAGRMGPEELAVQAVVDAFGLGDRPDAFARAYLARMREGR